MSKPKVAVIMGSDSDFDIVKKCLIALEKFGVEYDVQVISAHRNPHKIFEYATTAEARGIELFIAAAGKAAHLPGVIAGITPLPVIGIPIQTSFQGGLDSLLSIVQMPSGVPVATVAVNGAENAGILAAQMLSIKYPEIREKIKTFKIQLNDEVVAKNEKVQEIL
ncbi:5-(carboxyamino)imidazole ribonucleotide mutase [Acetobacterium carbinolicum]|jgi:5-(carboxyamino)imidazole ribonucleotide mutase|uniref:5-(carboxyamino)imidazole ribonucleotide mutase n=1 Tax=Acetobacterium TaxID=33951 RepID=UPI000DBEB6B3|nr:MULTISPECIES: 5-(carboxyamino)imidazole ribonucleotide mutase [unclassified Acetobacterium]AWW26038.1 5-(carboxyamino)imidazole ribonucleotide mutase [Acetobacterium sp. KB-1]MDK2942024.1 5-(carboxyamino)imidazole ribonucleotide mutase [Acetobacterium sp.]MDZ5723555.1 5-(carboxyamino)imidazole ribonucleotide mutase [Acetobacterium sp. K1/6]